MKLDKKFYGEIRKVKDDSVVPEDEYVVFLTHDNVFAATLPKYREECQAQGADEEHMAAVDKLIKNVNEWRAANPDKLKTPDAKGEKLLD